MLFLNERGQHANKVSDRLLTAAARQHEYAHIVTAHERQATDTVRDSWRLRVDLQNKPKQLGKLDRLPVVLLHQADEMDNLRNCRR